MTTETDTPVAAAPVNQADLVAKYVQLRDAKKALDDAHKAKVAQLEEGMQRIERYFMQRLDEAGANSVATPNGTFFKSEVVNVKVDDWQLTLDYIRKNDAWHLLNKAVNKTAVTDFVEQNEDLPPGISLRREAVVRVHRA